MRLSAAIKAINFFDGIVKGKRGTGHRRDTKMIHYRIGAQPSRTNGYAQLIEQCSQIKWMNLIQLKADYSRFIWRFTENFEIFERLHLICCIA